MPLRSTTVYAAAIQQIIIIHDSTVKHAYGIDV